MMSPFPKYAFYVKLIVSILDILEIDYEYLEIKKVIFGLKKSDEASAKLTNSICKAWNYLFLSRKNIEIDDLIFVWKILDKNNILTSNISLCIKKVFDLINNQTLAELEKIFNLFNLVLFEKSANAKVLYLLLANITIINYYNQYFVFPRDFLKNINTAITEKKLEEFSFYLSNKVDEFREPFNSFNIVSIKTIITKNLFFLNEKKIKQIRLFGSAIDGTYHNQSDIDIIIEFDCDMLRHQKKKYLCDFANFFSEKFGRDIDIHDLSEFETSSNVAYLSSIVIWNK